MEATQAMRHTHASFPPRRVMSGDLSCYMLPQRTPKTPEHTLPKSILTAFAERLSLSDLADKVPPRLSPLQVKTEVLSGLTVALALVPEAVAFSFVAGVHPLVGLYAAFIVGLITAILGGRPGMISGATGALAVVMVALVAQHGVEYLFATVVLMGLIQIARRHLQTRQVHPPRAASR